ncbi:unnamed protein product [Kluyveromyces dobzhanskii CBS 2104]|uniref:WGS project CCBQ000000000 data, contig 00015 n=1 Tax=Kluyveromyces dobzhanskii CBS 2104 TaxID=1427455 RepID=A0A0A8LB97_9SACH|nr:unnamed protein product [Kluyveromyces dobzhanskii CBS 2104]
MRFGTIFAALFVWYMTFVNAISNKKLLELSKKGGNVIRLNSKNYEKILNTPRKSDIVVFFTATSPQFSCTLCLEMGPSYDVVANSWFSDHANGISKQLEEHGVFFAKADFDTESKQLFSQFQLNSVPAFFVLKAGGKSISDVERITVATELGANHLHFLADTIKQVVQVPDLIVYEPINWGSSITTIVVVAVVTVIFKKYSSTVFNILTLRPLWGIVCSFSIITLVAGAMFIRIRGTPYSGVSSDRKSIVYFLEGQLQNQYAIESQIMTVLYSVLASSFIGLICVAPYIQKWYKNKKQYNRAAMVNFSLALFFTASIYIFYSALIAVFALKNTGYPFKLFKNPLK